MPTVSRRASVLPYLNLISGAVFGSLFLAYVYLLIHYNDDITGMNVLLMLMLVQLTPFLILVTRARFNFVGFILLNHFITYSLAKYNQLKTISHATAFNSGAISALHEMTICSILIICSYYITRYFLRGTSHKKNEFDFLNMTKGQYLYLGLFVMSQPFILGLIPPSLATMYFVINSVILVVLLCARAESKVTERWVRFGLVASTFLYFLKFGSLAVLGSLGAVLFMVSFVQWKPKNFVLVFIIALSATAIQTVKMEYRVAFQENSNAGELTRISTLVELLYWNFVEGHVAKVETEEDENALEVVDEEPETGSNGLLKGFSRVGDDSLERVLEMTPSLVPFWGGETYEYLPFMFIPRILWAGKPEKLAWNKFGRLYRFLSSDDYDTSVGFNFLTEGYMNFGFTGLYSVALIFGVLVYLVERLSGYVLSGNYYFTFIIFLVPLMTYGYDFVSMLNSLVLTASVILVFRTQLMKMARRDEYGFSK
jgi:hypothetical protein